MKLGLVQLTLDILLVVLSIFNILISPFTKVEESFNVQAVHDIITLGLDRLDRFDHMYFPGVVKRTCLSALMLSIPIVLLPETARRWALSAATLCVLVNTYFPTPLSLFSQTDLVTLLTETKIYQLLLTRIFLALFSCGSIIYLRRTLQSSCSISSKMIGIWFSMLLYPMPHILFYNSRFLPNFLCFPFTNLAIAHFLCGDIARALGLFAFVGIVFRFEILMYLGIVGFIAATGIFRERRPLVSYRSAIVSVAISVSFSLFLTGRLDSYFWDEPFTFPEIESFVFNVIYGNSSDWGVEPYTAYFTKYIPRLYASEFEIVPILSAIFAFISINRLKKSFKRRSTVDFINYGVGTITTLMWSTLFYILILSLNGHKEWRFVSYTIPIFCIVASSTFEYLLNRSKRSVKIVMYSTIIVAFTFSVISSIMFGLISSWNYTGGIAAQKLNLRLIDTYQNNKMMLKPITIHWDVGTCMNGASLFTQIGDNKLMRDALLDEYSIAKYWIIYDKTENAVALEQVVNDFDYWVQYDDEPIMPLEGNYEWLLIDVIEGYAGINKHVLLDLFKNPKKLGFQIMNSITTLDYTWLANVWDSTIEKKIRGRIYERAEKKSMQF